MQKNNKVKKSISIILLLSILISLITPIRANAADKTITKLVYQGKINQKIRHKNEIWTNYPDSRYGNYPATIPYEEDGFKGTLQAKRIKLVPKNKKNQWVRNRKTTLSGSQTGYFEFKELAKFPKEIKMTYNDKKSGQTKSYSISKTGSFYKTGKNRVRNETQVTDGRKENYDKTKHRYLGYMSNNSTTYYNGKYKFSNSPRPPTDYYGPNRNFAYPNPYKLIDIKWADSKAINADWFATKNICPKAKNNKCKNLLVYGRKNGVWGWWFRSERGIYNKYRKGVWLKYRLRIREDEYKQNYRGTVNLPDYVEYQYADKWDVYVEYSGKVKDLNTNNFYIDDLKIAPETIDLGNSKTATANRPVTLNFTVGNERYPIENSNKAYNPTVRIKYKNQVVWEDTVSVLPDSTAKKSVTLENIPITRGTNGFSVEVNPDRKIPEFKPDTSDIYADNIKTTKVSGIVYQGCDECATARKRNKNKWSEKWEWYKQSGVIKSGNIKGRHYQYCKVTNKENWSQTKNYYEEYKITDVYFRSKWSKDTNKNDYPKAGKGWIKVTDGGVGKIKAGYGFEVMVVTNYKTNRNNPPAPSNKQSKYYRGDNKGVYGDGYCDFTTRYPSVTPIDSPNIIYMNMPYKGDNGRNACYILKPTSNTEWYNNEKIFEIPERKSFDIKTERKTYTNPTAKAGKYRIDIVTPRPDKPNKFLGYNPENPVDLSGKKPLHDCTYFYVEILGQDDLKSHIMQ